MSKALKAALESSPSNSTEGQRRRVREILDEGWDLFLRVLSDGSLVIQAVAVRTVYNSLLPCLNIISVEH